MRSNIGEQIRLARRRRAMKRLLRCANVTIPAKIMYNENALRKMVRALIANRERGADS